MVECDPKQMDEVRRNWPFLRDRRIDAYGADHRIAGWAHEHRMPAEWEPHEATWLAWPHETSDWPGQIRDCSMGVLRNRRGMSRVERGPDSGERRARRSTGRAACLKRIGRRS